jgi:hypothetical protein
MNEQIIPQHNGYKILNYTIRNPILDALIKLGEKAVEQYEEPYAVSITFSFKKAWVDLQEAKNLANRVKHKAPISIFRDSFLKSFSRAGSITKAKDTHSPMFLWVKENKKIRSDSKEWYQVGEEEKKYVLAHGYEHYHCWLYIDYAKTDIAAIEKALERQYEKGVIRHNKIYLSVERGLSGIDSKRKSLITRFADFVEHASYASKDITKPVKGRNWG